MNDFSKSRKDERGVALLVAMFTLVLLSVIGLGLMYATNMETSINSNYRDKQSSIYAASAGLQEARDRIQPATHNIAAPTALPSLTAANVIYIINPKGGETVAPWDINNKYADTELCQEHILGLTGTPGVPCTTLPSGSAWYTVKDNSLSASAPWNLSPPTDMKWVRITLKSNNMTSVAANGDSSNGTQTCWDGQHQILLPPGYGPTCMTNHGIGTLALTNPGTGYTSPPTVTIGPPGAGGVQATGTVTGTSLLNGQVTSITVNTPGVGYSSAPTVTITGDGTGATASAVVALPGAPVTSLSLTPGNQCYSSPPPVSIIGGGGSGATATATLSTTQSCVVSWSITGSCSSSQGHNATVTGIGLTGGGGSGFSGSITVGSNGKVIVSSSMQNGGSGYTGAPTIPLTGLTGCTGPTATVIRGYPLQSLTLTSGGSDYTSAPAVSIGTGAGTSATPATATSTIGAIALGAGTVTSVNVLTTGSGYSTATVTLTGGGATVDATATAVLGTTYTLTGMTITNPGDGYVADPNVTLSGGGGAGATAVANVQRGTNYGSVYLMTSLAVSDTGARTMSQMEVTTPVLNLAFEGALVLDGPAPIIQNMPDSHPFEIHGSDANSCGETARPDGPAIGAYDDPENPTSPSSVSTIIGSIPSGRLGNYTGSGGTPSVQNVFGALGETMTTATGLKALIDAVRAAPGATTYPNDPGSINYGSAANPVINYVDGDLTVTGSKDGYGILVVTGTAVLSGNFSWHGIVLVVGDGIADYGGGGNGIIQGSMYVAKIWDNSVSKNLLTPLGSPSFNWNGGGGNGIYYDHCWANNMANKIPFVPPPTAKPLKVLSMRSLSY